LSSSQIQLERFRPGEEVQNLTATGVSQNEWISNLGGNGEQNHESRPLILWRRSVTLFVYTTAGTSDVTRRLESLLDDARDHIRGHLNEYTSLTITDAAPTPGIEEGCRDRPWREPCKRTPSSCVSSRGWITKEITQGDFDRWDRVR
jgi:hypothetical protein